MSRDWTGVKGIDPYIEDICGVCGRPPHPCDDTECVPATAPIAEKLRVAMRTVNKLENENRCLVALVGRYCPLGEVTEEDIKWARELLGI